MVEALRHESFYTTGTWVNESLGVYVGWAARQNSFSEGMPLRNERGDVTLVFSGEDYREPDAARRLKERGHACQEAGPSYLVHLYEEDSDFLKNLNGRFQGLIADSAQGTVTLFNDRFGLQRIYYHEAAGADGAFYFSAEAKAILAVRPELRSADPRSLGEYIACGCVLENRTLFRDIHALPPGSAWTFRSGALEKKAAYFEPREWEDQEPLDSESYYQHLRDAFATALPHYFNGKERIGVSLTGGLDTRIIMAWRKATPGSLPCYTFGSMYRENHI
jgi:asparagine synthase (glutamine-hydrolysing)